ncbi:MAG: hypothetical protein JO072_14485 [Parafilimonas sp.]|nr:hypothetical protein [Parafilimonas sp.]
MRLFVVCLIMTIAKALSAQVYQPFGTINYEQHPVFGFTHSKDSISKWSLGTYAGISTGFVFYKGGHSSYFSAPLSLQLNRALNNNLYAFASITAAPAYVNFNNTFLNTNSSKFNQPGNFYKANSFSAYTSANIGLMYVNNANTFSISGSFGFERSSYPAYEYNSVNTQKQNPFYKNTARP